MASDLLSDPKRSPKVLRQHLENAANKIDWPLPQSGKIFLGVARMQGFDALPKILEKSELDSYIANGCLELNRGLTSTPGVPASFYSEQLGTGVLYPGTLTAHGHGMYFAEPSLETDPEHIAATILPRRSEVAFRYATGEIGGIIVRAALKPKARTIGQDDLYEIFRNERNRAARAGIEDLGTYAAAVSYDAFFIDGGFTYCKERMWVVVNRGELVVQRLGLQYAGDKPPGP